ncbi:hypothetical protein GUJ93_ZPchr0013g37965 [Zizania palustris]|uniref:Uncharacterized protein n=1 Tax=Zizania palustris TaxID=103762 RepID=A0A8J5WQ87_ZIZPA|nr:hypothetical protein GUJ93_ZPchr0013g37965 [Zizania palustris]
MLAWLAPTTASAVGIVLASSSDWKKQACFHLFVRCSRGTGFPDHGTQQHDSVQRSSASYAARLLGGGFYDSGKHDSSTFTKGKHKTRFFRKALKDYQHENKKRDKTFFAEMEKIYSKRSSSSSSSSCSSDEEIVIEKGKERDDLEGLYFMAFRDKPKSHSRHSRRHRKSFYSMALGDKEEKGSSNNSDDDDDEKVSPYEQEVVNLLEENRQELKYREKLLRGAKKRINELESELAMANGKIECLSSSPCLGGSSECPNCEVLLCDLTTLKSR